jgi:hypothetical protein
MDGRTPAQAFIEKTAKNSTAKGGNANQRKICQKAA